MNPKSFLTWGGVVLVIVALLGFFGVTGPTSTDSIFGDLWFFTPGENWAHLILGVVALLAAFAFPASSQKPLVMIVGILALFFAVYNIFSNSFMGANLESPMDLILHAVVGIWALMSTRGGETAMSSSSMPPTTPPMNPGA